MTDGKYGGFGKHYQGMYSGSLVGAGAVVFALMGYIISNQVPDQTDAEKLVVELNPKLLAFILGETEAKVEEAIAFLTTPDPTSRTKEEDGRRLVRMGQFLYWVVNGRKFRAMRDMGRRREQNREAKRRERQRRAIHNRAGEREGRYVEALANGDEQRAEEIAAEGLPDQPETTPGEPEPPEDVQLAHEPEPHGLPRLAAP